ncbi:DNA/RNA non-specific endonuclease [Lactobacillus sp. LC28-10]|uniref:DNA/RNA non-specific endonuclease n=1 Tax=Secundilactobacillus angelensis TaxID=2722706 RepID=A0ABX1KXS0_9LACO|nr:DNA/RNA non-specific endonuclease [Secundilactobacillus angelensis]MCH5462873.1 DNA/RNA non-specific endonuclease [Secundilactobacillus angelensis]NLR18749.1 DNA/RNA non-specific endonuclease [Secundilactobacillus angelensis]
MPRRRRTRRNDSFFTWLVIAVAIIAGISATGTGNRSNSDSVGSDSSSTTLQKKASSVIQSFKGNENNRPDTKPHADGQTQANSTTQLAELTYQGQQVVKVNHGVPTFTKADLSTAKGPWQVYHNLDQYNRVTGADALLAKSLMPRSQREPLYVDPTGWHNKRFTYQGKTDWLYNRSHLIGYQFTGQNNNPKNLMTGTRSLNSPGMEDYETEVATYLKLSPTNYVRYRVTPVFRGNELLARGVQMQAQSIGNNAIRFNIYIFNVQPGAKIDYSTGRSVVTHAN